MDAYGSAVVNVEYIPSSLNEVESSAISLTHPELGEWRYKVEGRGELPGVMPEHRPTATVGEGTSYMFAFRNPFKQVMSISVVLKTEADMADSFTLLMKKCVDVPINPFSSIQIPISFTPRTIEEKRAIVSEMHTRVVLNDIDWSLGGGAWKHGWAQSELGVPIERGCERSPIPALVHIQMQSQSAL